MIGFTMSGPQGRSGFSFLFLEVKTLDIENRLLANFGL